MQSTYSSRTTEDPTRSLLANPLFANVSSLLEKGIPSSAEGYQVPRDRNKNISSSEVQLLLDSNHELFERYQIIPELIRQTPSWKEMQAIPERRQLMDSILADPFTQELLKLKRENRISEGKLIYLLQEDAYWQSRFRQWQILGLVRLKKQEGRFTSTPLQLDDIRTETIAEIYE